MVRLTGGVLGEEAGLTLEDGTDFPDAESTDPQKLAQRDFEEEGRDPRSQQAQDVGYQKGACVQSSASHASESRSISRQHKWFMLIRVWVCGPIRGCDWHPQSTLPRPLSKWQQRWWWSWMRISEASESS